MLLQSTHRKTNYNVPNSLTSLELITFPYYQCCTSDGRLVTCLYVYTLYSIQMRMFLSFWRSDKADNLIVIRRPCYSCALCVSGWVLTNYLPHLDALMNVLCLCVTLILVVAKVRHDRPGQPCDYVETDTHLFYFIHLQNTWFIHLLT
jgi:hypothetical protein